MKKKGLEALEIVFISLNVYEYLKRIEGFETKGMLKKYLKNIFKIYFLNTCNCAIFLSISTFYN